MFSPNQSRDNIPFVDAITEFELVDDVLVFYRDGGPLSEADFVKWLHAIETLPYKKYLGATGAGMGISGVQRRKGAAIFKARGIPFAAITDDPLVRGAVTAVSWLGANIAAFSWENTQKSTEWLGLDASVAKRVLACLSRLKVSVNTRLRARELRK